MYANHQIAEETAAAAAMAGGAPQLSAAEVEATEHIAIAAPHPQPPDVAAPHVGDVAEAKCREFFENVSAWPSDDQIRYLGLETGRGSDELRRWFDDTRRAAHQAAAEQQYHQEQQQAQAQGGVQYDAAAEACAAAAAAAAAHAVAEEHQPNLVADVTHAAAAAAQVTAPPVYEHLHHPSDQLDGEQFAAAENAASAVDVAALAAQHAEAAALARSRARARSRLQEYRAKCLLFFETVSAWPSADQLTELSADTGRTVEQLRRWFYQARHRRYKAGEMVKNGIANGTGSVVAVADSSVEGDGVEYEGAEGGEAVSAAAAVTARPGIPHVIACREFFRDVSKYPHPSQFRDLAKATGRTVEQLRKWFYKERYELKKKSLDEEGAAAEVAASAAAAAAEGGEAAGAAAAEGVRYEMDSKEYNKFMRAYLENETAYPSEEAVTELAVKTRRGQDTVRRWFYKVRHRVRSEGGKLLGAPEDTAATSGGAGDIRRNFYDTVTKYPSRDQLEELCAACDKTQDQMRRWFEKQRHRDRAAELEIIEREGGPEIDEDDADGTLVKRGRKRKSSGGANMIEEHPPTPEERAAYLKILRHFFADVTQWPSEEQIANLTVETGRAPEQLRRWFYKTRHAEYHKRGLVHSPKPTGPRSARDPKSDPRREFFETVTDRPTKEQLLELAEKSGNTEEQLRRYFYKMRYKVKEEARMAQEQQENGDGDEDDQDEIGPGSEVPEHSPEIVAILKDFLVKKDAFGGGDATAKDNDGDDATADADADANPIEDQVASLAQETGLSPEQVREWLVKSRAKNRRDERRRRAPTDGGFVGRARIPPDVIRALEGHYESVTKYPDADALARLAGETEERTTAVQVRKWFERKRFRDRRDGREALELDQARRERAIAGRRKRSHDDASGEVHDGATSLKKEEDDACGEGASNETADETAAKQESHNDAKASGEPTSPAAAKSGRLLRPGDDSSQLLDAKSEVDDAKADAVARRKSPRRVRNTAQNELMSV